MVINKQLSTSPVSTINLSTFAHRGSAQVWQLTASNVITHLSDVTVSGTTLVTTLPAQSITLFVIPRIASPPTPPTNLRIVR
jgi:hypothetical protein